VTTVPVATTPQRVVTFAGPLGMLVRGLGSMRLAVVLVVLLGLLTWLGTLAQVDTSLFAVQREYFESWFVVARLPLSFWGHVLITEADGKPWPLKIPLPGAYPVMALLFVNLLVGGMLRLRIARRTAGVLIAHLGIAMLLVAGFVKLHYSYSGAMSLLEAPRSGEAVGDRVFQASTFVSFHDYELALLRDLGSTIEERIVPEAVLAGASGGGSVTLRAAGLPFTVQVSHWQDNCMAMPKGPMFLAETPVIDGVFLRPLKPSIKREEDIAGCYVTVVADSGERAEGIVMGEDTRMVNRRPVTAYRRPFTFTIAGQRYGLDLRHVLYDLPFQVRLDEFIKNDHPGTTMASDYRSKVTVQARGETIPAQIFMNTPLRRDGFVLYQASYGAAGTTAMGEPVWFTTLEVANSPSDQWPKFACYVIAVGLLVHFMTKLSMFLKSSTRKELRA